MLELDNAHVMAVAFSRMLKDNKRTIRVTDMDKYGLLAKKTLDNNGVATMTTNRMGPKLIEDLMKAGKLRIERDNNGYPCYVLGQTTTDFDFMSYVEMVAPPVLKTLLSIDLKSS